MVASSFLLNAHLAKGTWLRRPPDLIHVFLRGFVLIAHLVKLMTRLTFVPLALVVDADFCFAFGAGNERVLTKLVDLAMTTTLCRTPQPVKSSRFLCLSTSAFCSESNLPCLF